MCDVIGDDYLYRTPEQDTCIACVDEMKSRADWQLETSLLRELVDTVTQRNSVVESMETDRLRYSTQRV